MIDRIKADVKAKFENHPKRYEHTLGVVQTAVSLALSYGMDPDKAYLAALFHDYTKYDTVAMQTALLTKEVIAAYEDFPVMYHALSAAEVLNNTYGIEDEEILNAIRYHVCGREGMTMLDKIILIADKTEPSRSYELVSKLRAMSLISLDATIKTYLTDLIENPKQKHINNQQQIKK